jgi:hypothetical protein
MSGYSGDVPDNSKLKMLVDAAAGCQANYK